MSIHALGVHAQTFCTDWVCRVWKPLGSRGRSDKKNEDCYSDSILLQHLAGVRTSLGVTFWHIRACAQVEQPLWPCSCRSSGAARGTAEGLGTGSLDRQSPPGSHPWCCCCARGGPGRGAAQPCSPRCWRGGRGGLESDRRKRNERGKASFGKDYTIQTSVISWPLVELGEFLAALKYLHHLMTDNNNVYCRSKVTRPRRYCCGEWDIKWEGDGSVSPLYWNHVAHACFSVTTFCLLADSL